MQESRTALGTLQHAYIGQEQADSNLCCVCHFLYSCSQLDSRELIMYKSHISGLVWSKGWENKF